MTEGRAERWDRHPFPIWGAQGIHGVAGSSTAQRKLRAGQERGGDPLQGTGPFSECTEVVTTS